jgi:glutamate synthase domain-containing protein 3
MGLHKEVLKGRTQQVFFDPEEAENYFYYGTHDVDFNKRTEVDAKNLMCKELNTKLNSLMSEGYGTIVVKNPQGKHSLGVGILNKLNLIFEGSLGYFGVGSVDGPVVRITGRVGWSCAENMMAGKVVIEKNAGSCFGAAIRGGDLICKGSVGARTGIDMKGGTIMVGGDAGAFTGFMMQRGRIIILGNAGINLGDSMYDGTIFVGGTIKSLGSDAIKSKLTSLDVDWLKRKLKIAEIGSNFNFSKMTKIVAGKKLWNYDQLEPTEKKGAI